jgi:hypothetical protein
VQRLFQKRAVTFTTVITVLAGWTFTTGVGVAGAVTRFRSGSRAHLVDINRLVPNGAASSGQHLTGPDVMASIVGLMAVLAFAFLVVTFIRRRVHAPAFTPRGAA